MTIDDLIFTGFNSRVAALDRNTGQLLWQWVSPKGSGYVTLLLDGDRLIVSVMGYMYCLDPRTGAPLWYNPMPGFGTGVTSFASVRGHSDNALGEAAHIAQRQATDSAASTHHPA